MSINEDIIGDVFTSWKPLLTKARKAKGLSKWKKLQHLAHKLENKQISSIKFTAVDPSTGDTSTHILGSVEGNQKFLLGYVNPGFHIAAYHWQVVDPSLSDEDAELIHKQKGHPAIPQFWYSNNLPGNLLEGDTEEGSPHPSFTEEKRRKAQKELEEKSIVKVDRYEVDVLEGLVNDKQYGAVYAWDLVQATYPTSTNEDLEKIMEENEVEKALDSLAYIPPYGERLEELRKSYSEREWDPDVYPLVQSTFPLPGSLVTLGKGLYGLLTSTSIEFYDEQGFSTPISLFGEEVISLDLRKGGATFPSVILNLATEYMGVDKDTLLSFSSSETSEEEELPPCVKGLPTPGISYVESSERDLTVIDGILRVKEV